jgi:hypothetical protein
MLRKLYSGYLLKYITTYDLNPQKGPFDENDGCPYTFNDPLDKALEASCLITMMKNLS